MWVVFWEGSCSGAGCPTLSSWRERRDAASVAAVAGGRVRVIRNQHMAVCSQGGTLAMERVIRDEQKVPGRSSGHGDVQQLGVFCDCYWRWWG